MTTAQERTAWIRRALAHRQAIVTPGGALAAWHGAASTGRIPDDTYMVRSGSAEQDVDWSLSNAHAMTRVTFDALLAEARSMLGTTPLQVHRSAVADPLLAVHVRITTTSALHAVFADSLLLPDADGAQDTLELLVIPEPLRSPDAYRGALRECGGAVVPRVIAMDLERRIGVIIGTSYLGALKKTVFTMLNHLLPAKGVLPLHCSAAADTSGATHLFLGLSGTGKTTLSADPALRCIGDDEHAWSNRGIANIEGGCYAKLAHLRRVSEPRIYDAIFRHRPVDENGVIIENALTLPDGSIDVDDLRLTENSRAAYPQRYLEGAVLPAVGGHPKTILFLTADASGVLPPVARLNHEQAQLWYAVGYTSKLAGTELGVRTPKPTFSRLFGAPFMTRPTSAYLSLFAERLREHQPSVYLVNTGWTGGPYGTGQRMSITASRAIVQAALSGELTTTPVRRDPFFGFDVPQRCPGLDAACLDPRSTWKDASAYDNAAKTLASSLEHAYGASRAT